MDYLGSGNNQLIAEVLTNVLLAALVAVIGMVTAWVNKRRRWADVQTKQHDLALIADIARTAVGAVEQLSATYGWSPEDKLVKAMVRAQGLAKQHGVTISDDQLHTLIEDAVLAMKQGVTVLQAATVPPEASAA